MNNKVSLKYCPIIEMVPDILKKQSALQKFSNKEPESKESNLAAS